MKKICLFLISVLITFVSVQAQTYKKTDSGIEASINSMKVEIEFYSPSIVRILKSPEGKTFKKESLSVIKSPQKTTLGISQKGDELVLKSEKLIALLNLKNGQVSFKTLKGNLLLNEMESGAKFTDFNDAGVKTYSVAQSFQLEKDEAIYGLGIQQQGKMVKRNLKLNMVQNNTEDFVTFFQSAKGYGLFWDNYSPTTFSDDQHATSFSSEVGDCID